MHKKSHSCFIYLLEFSQVMTSKNRRKCQSSEKKMIIMAKVTILFLFSFDDFGIQHLSKFIFFKHWRKLKVLRTKNISRTAKKSTFTLATWMVWDYFDSGSGWLSSAPIYPRLSIFYLLCKHHPDFYLYWLWFLLPLFFKDLRHLWKLWNKNLRLVNNRSFSLIIVTLIHENLMYNPFH